jgi:UDP-glucose 4-epimerase
MGTCLVTGGAGFIGSHLVDRLIQEGHIVLVVDDLSSGKAENVHPEAKFFDDFDIRRDSFAKTKLKFDVIYHLAAMSRIPDCKEDPRKAMEVNSQGTVNMLETARTLGSRFVYAGSSCSYWPKYSNVYAYSKAEGEEHCRFYSKHFGVSTLIARFFNVYGPRCPRQGPGSTVVGIFERQKAAGEPLTVTGDGRQRRDFIHVGDIVDGLVRLYTKSGYGEHFDFGSSYSYGILEIARMFAPKEVQFLPRPEGEAEYTRCNSDSLEKAWKDLGWEPKIHIQNYISEHLNELARNTN